MTVAVLLVALLGMVSFVSVLAPVAATPAPMGFPGTGDTIRINSDTELLAAKIAYGWNGTGSSIDPIVLDGTKGDRQIDINGSTVGLYIANVTGLYFEIRNWTINNTANSGIGIQINNVRTAFSVHDVVVNNTMVGIDLNATRGAQVYDCMIFNCETCVLVGKSLSTQIHDNIMYYSGLTIATTRAVHLYYNINGAVDNNQITDIKSPILTEFCKITNIGNNDIRNCTLGLYNDQASEHTNLHNNTFENVGTAVYMNFDSNNATVVSNKFSNVASSAVFLTDVNDAQINENEFTNCTLGIGGTSDVRRLTIYHNVFVDCDRGVNLNITNVGSITYNAFLGSASYGVYLQSRATNISVHHNVFKDCNAGGTSQVFDFANGNNFWNESGFGNYWNDHTAPGAQDTGISDTPYQIDGGGQVDHFPLTYTIGPVGNLGAVSGAGPKVLLSWDASNYSAGSLFSSPESQYVIYRTGGGDPVKQWVVNIGTDSLIDTSVSSAKTYTYSVLGNNTYGNSGNRSVSISTAAANVPVVNITSPTEGAIFATSTIPVTWEGWGNGSAITNYEIRLDAGMWISRGNLTSYSFAGVADGLHLITVRVTNLAGNTGFDAIMVIVDTTAPSLTITSPADGSKIGSASITVSWMGSDASSGIKNYSLRVDGGAWKDENLATSDVVIGLEDGNHTFEVMALDNAGNSVTKGVNITVDMTAPSVTIIAPVDGSFTNSRNFTAIWNATDSTGVNSTWARLINTTGAPLSWVNVTGESSTWITNLTTGQELLVDGVWQLAIACNDTLGNNGTTMSQFTVDTLSPSIAIITPASGSFNNTGSVEVVWNATDESLSFIEYRVDAGNWTNVGLNSSQLLGLVDGTYVVEVRATDMAGNSATASVTIIVDMVPPVISNISPANGSSLNIVVPTFTWDASDSSSGVNRTMVSLDGVDAYIGLNTSYTSAIVLVQGEHTFNITVWDNAGNEQTVSIVFYIDLTSPVVAILNPVEGGFYNSTTVIAAWVGTDPSGIAYYESKLDAEAWQNMSASTLRSLTLTEGEHNFQVRAFDNAGNNYTSDVTFVVDLTDPLLAILSPSEGAIFGSSDVMVSWTGYDALSGMQGYWASVDGQNWTQMPGMETSHTFTGLSDGTHVIAIKAVDNASNYVVSEVGFVVDTTSPYVVITQPSDGSFTGDDSVMVEWTIEENTTGLLFWWVWMDDNAPVNVTGEYFHTFSPVPEGAHDFQVKAWDLAGNAQEKSVSVTVDLSAPVIDITSPTNLEHLGSRTVTVNFNATDTLSGVKEIWVKLASSADWQSVGTADSYTFSVVFDTSTTPLTFMVRAQDNVGNEATNEVQFFIDTVAPSVVSTVPANHANGVLRNAQIVIDFSEAMLNSSVKITTSPSVTGTYHWNTAFTQVTFTPGSSLSFATHYDFNVVGTDLAGNVLSGTNSWDFTTIAHVTGFVKDKNGNGISGATISLTNGTSWTAISGEDGNFSLDVPIGTYNLTVSASGQKDLVRNDVEVKLGTNELGDLGMSPEDNWTLWIIVIVVVVVIALLAFYFLYMRKKSQEPKPEEKPKAEEKPKDKK